MELPPELVSTLGGRTPHFAVRSATMRSPQTVRNIRIGAGLMAFLALVCFFVMLPAGLRGDLKDENGAGVDPVEGAFVSAGVGSLMLAGSAFMFVFAHRSATLPGPWYAALEGEIVIVSERRTLRIPWGAFESVVFDGSTIGLRGRRGMELGISFSQNGRQTIEIVDPSDPVNVARMCGALIASAPPIGRLGAPMGAIGLGSRDVPR